METKTIKLNENNYRWLAGVAAEIQKRKGAPVSMDEALSSMRTKKFSDLAGSWDMTGKEAERMKASLKKAWKTWKTTSV
ncbi:hypothetical protein CMI48_04390 [Candidatus Pacearchaeota archaeon]|jgi:hypothetical protein|nr:hypothetical protein [Candidatus Pacearchaeota archaeon]|tara:strand:+ start:276 stop:512 length:237 start_codon:yes stop_codon:yes gene_type:complete